MANRSTIPSTMKLISFFRLFILSALPIPVSYLLALQLLINGTAFIHLSKTVLVLPCGHLCSPEHQIAPPWQGPGRVCQISCPDILWKNISAHSCRKSYQWDNSERVACLHPLGKTRSSFRRTFSLSDRSPMIRMMGAGSFLINVGVTIILSSIARSGRSSTSMISRATLSLNLPSQRVFKFPDGFFGSGCFSDYI